MAPGLAVQGAAFALAELPGAALGFAVVAAAAMATIHRWTVAARQAHPATTVTPLIATRATAPVLWTLALWCAPALMILAAEHVDSGSRLIYALARNGVVAAFVDGRILLAERRRASLPRLGNTALLCLGYRHVHLVTLAEERRTVDLYRRRSARIAGSDASEILPGQDGVMIEAPRPRREAGPTPAWTGTQVQHRCAQPGAALALERDAFAEAAQDH